MATAAVTGANRGIGLELTRQLAERGDDVIGVCRSSSDDLERVASRVIEDIDVTNSDSIGALASALSGTEIDLLINNAGLLRRETLDDMDWDGIRQQFEVNSLGPLRVTHALLDSLNDGGKIAIITSRMGSIGDNTSGSAYGYRMSKAAVNMAGVSLAHDLRPRGIAVALLHPGYVKTGMTDHQGNVTPDVAAGGLIERIDDLTIESSGGFWHANGEPLPW